MEILAPPVMEPLKEKLSVGDCDPWMLRIRTRLRNTLRSASPCPRVPASFLVQMRQLCHFFRADVKYGLRVAEGLGIEIDPSMMPMSHQPMTV